MNARAILFVLAVACATPAPAQVSGSQADRVDALSNTLYWQLRIGKARPAADDTLYVLIHSSKDCGYCVRWKQSPAGLANAKRMVDAFPKVRVFMVERDFLDDPERIAQYPPELRFEYERRFGANDLSPGVPLFEVILQKQVVFRGAGIDQWVNKVLPAVVNIEKRREGAAPPPPPAAKESP